MQGRADGRVLLLDARGATAAGSTFVVTADACSARTSVSAEQRSD
jgi:hypothetical protein